MKNIYMKHIKYSFLIGMIIISLISTSCTKNIVDEFEPIEEKWESVEDFTGSINTDKRVSIANAEKEFVIKTNSATYHFQENSILNYNGTVVSGPIEMIYNEMTGPNDIIQSGIDSEGTAGETLVQYFAARVNFKQGNNTLKIDNLKPITIYIESTENTVDKQNTFTWLNDGVNHGWFPTTSYSLEAKDWNLNINGNSYIGSGFKIDMYDTEWITLADFEYELYENNNLYGNLKVNLADRYHNSNTKVYAIHKDQMSIIPIENVSGIYSHGQILKDTEVRLIMISVINDKLHFGRKDIITGSVNEFDINPREVSYIELIEELKRL